MRVLFVCNANAGRSQVAQVYFDQLSPHESSGVGMAVDEITARLNLPSNKLKDLAKRPLEYIQREFGVDISERERWNRPIDPVPQRKSLRTHTLGIQSRDICQLSRSYRVFGHSVHPATGISPIFQASSR